MAIAARMGYLAAAAVARSFQVAQANHALHTQDKLAMSSYGNNIVGNPQAHYHRPPTTNKTPSVNPPPSTEAPHTVHHGSNPPRGGRSAPMPRRRRYSRRRTRRRRYRTRRRTKRGPPCVRDLHKLKSACSKHYIQHICRSHHQENASIPNSGILSIGPNVGGGAIILMDRLLQGGMLGSDPSSTEYKSYFTGTPTNMDTMGLLFGEYRVTKMTVEATYIDCRARGVLTNSVESADYPAGNVNLPVCVGGYLDDFDVSAINNSAPLDTNEPELLPGSKLAWIQPGGSARFTWKCTPRTLHPGVDLSENDINAVTTATRAAHPVNVRLFARRVGAPDIADNGIDHSGMWVIRVWREAIWSNKTEAQT